MKNKYLLPIIFILLISATKISLHRSLWNFKDHKRIEYDLSMNAFNEVNYLNQKNGVKVKADLVVKIKDSIYANILLENKRIIEKINDSITSYEEIKQVMKSAADNEMKNILGYCDDPVVSQDFIGDVRTSIFDAEAGMELNSRFFKIISWYDNECGYSNKLIDLAKHINNL